MPNQISKRSSIWEVAGAIAFTLICAGCESKLAVLSDQELQDKVYACSQASDQSPGYAITCDNYRRECKVRREAGKFVC